MHSLLKRQLRKAFGDAVPEGEQLGAFVKAINAAYKAADADRQQFERSLHLASDELYERNLRLESELEERKRLELELRLAEKLRGVGLLAAGIAHEINTPIQYISDSLHFLNDAFGDLARVNAAHEPLLVTATESCHQDVKAKICELIEQVDLAFLQAEIPQALARCIEGTRRVAKIVRALKEFSHPDSATQEIADINASIKNTLIVAANEFRYVATVELELAAAQQVQCNVGEIQQVLLNLIVNAAHAIAERVGNSGERGVIRITTREEGSNFLITISDNGAGMPNAVRERIFEPFFTTKPVGKGTGQGLSISRSLIVDRHAGNLTFESTEGCGTTFTVGLPIAGKASAKAA